MDQRGRPQRYGVFENVASYRDDIGEPLSRAARGCSPDRVYRNWNMLSGLYCHDAHAIEVTADVFRARVGGRSVRSFRGLFGNPFCEPDTESPR